MCESNMQQSVWELAGASFARITSKVLHDIAQEVDIFRENTFHANPNPFIPPYEVATCNLKVTINVDLPGIDRDIIELSISSENILTIRCERARKHPENTSIINTVSYGKMELVYELPDDVDACTMCSQMADGVLTIEIQRVQHSGIKSNSNKIECAA